MTSAVKHLLQLPKTQFLYLVPDSRYSFLILEMAAFEQIKNIHLFIHLTVMGSTTSIYHIATTLFGYMSSYPLPITRSIMLLRRQLQPSY